jgi:hypothetical protein
MIPWIEVNSNSERGVILGKGFRYLRGVEISEIKELKGVGLYKTRIEI